MGTRYGTRNSLRRKAAKAATDLAEGTVSATTTQVDVTAQGDIRLQDAAGGEYVALQAPSSLGASYTLTFPADDGDNTEVLTTNGSGVLTWGSAGGGAVSAVANGVDNRGSTFSSADELNGEANLTFDGSALTVVGEVVVGSGSAQGVVESNGNHDIKIQTGNSTTGTIVITDGADGAITLTPNGTGAVAAASTLVVGTGSGTGAILSSGNHDLSLLTGNSTTGQITIEDGADGDILLDPDGSGVVESTGFFRHEKGIRGAYTAVTANTTLSSSHFIIQASRSAELTLPANGTAGRWYFVVRIDDGTSNGTVELLVDDHDSESIEGDEHYHLESDGDGVALYDNGTNWIVMWEKRAPTRAAFDPTKVENCVIWLSGGVGITTDGGGDVTQWADQSGSSNHAVQLGSETMPTTATVNGISNVPSFTAASATNGDVLNMTTNVLTGNDEPWTIFFVGDVTGNWPAGTHLFGVGSDANDYLYSAETSGFGKKLFVDGASKAGVAMLNSNAGAETQAAQTLNGVEVIIASYAGPGQLKLDGGGRVWTCSEDARGTEQVYDQLNIGASSGDGTTATIDGFTGKVCEVIVYQRAWDHGESMLVRDYLLSRWT